MTSEGSGHASCAVTFDAVQTCSGLLAPHHDCHCQVTSTGKIDFLAHYSGSSRLSLEAAFLGLRVGQPVDLRNGLGLQSRTDSHCHVTRSGTVV